MSKIRNGVGAVLAMGILIVGLSACEKKEGPMERAGKTVDKAVEDAGKQVEKAGEKVQEAAKDAGKQVEKVGEKIQEAAKDAKK